MSVVISETLVLAGVADGLSLDHPVIGWQNLATAATVTSSEVAEDNHPASNLANPATHEYWESTTTVEQYIYVVTNEIDPIDYIAVARHNFASGSIPVSVEVRIAGNYTEVVSEVMLPNDGPALFRFVPVSTDIIRIRLQAGDVPPRAAVVYTGKLLVLERKIYVGHTPMPHARKTNIANGRSESGEFLGRIVLGSWRETIIPLSLITPAWYRAYMDPFLAVAKETPFFFAWRPESYPFEIGYVWLIDDPMPTPSDPANLIAFSLSVGGAV